MSDWSQDHSLPTLKRAAITDFLFIEEYEWNDRSSLR